MRIDYAAAFNNTAETEHDLWRSMQNDRVMQGLAFQHALGQAPDVPKAEFKKLAVYLGFWPMYYAEALILEKQDKSMDDQLYPFAQGMVLMLTNCKRDHLHIPFTEAVVFWEYLCEAGHTSVSTLEMIDAVVEEYSRHASFQRSLPYLFCLQGRTSVEAHDKASPSINAFLRCREDIAEALFSKLKPDFFKNAMELFPTEIWDPYASNSTRRDMVFSRDLGL